MLNFLIILLTEITQNRYLCKEWFIISVIFNISVKYTYQRTRLSKIRIINYEQLLQLL